MITAAQLRDHGIDNRMAIARLCHAGLLVRVRAGAYRLPDLKFTPDAKRLSALLWLPGAVLGFDTALELHGLKAGSGATVHLVSSRRVTEAPAGVQAHRSRHLARGAVVTLRGFPVTSLERTLLDVAGTDITEEALTRLVEEAWRQRKLDPSTLLPKLGDNHRRGMSGKGRLRRLLLECRKRGRAMESPLEVRLWFAMQRAGIPPPQVQVEFADGLGHPMRVDFFFQGERLVVEAMGAQHFTPEASRKDALRQARLVAEGVSVLPVTSQMLDDDEAATMALIANALRKRRVENRIVIQEPVFIPAA